MKIKDLKQPYREIALIEQEAQGNEKNEYEYLKASFFWDKAFCEHNFWEDVYFGRNPEITPEIKAKFPSVFKEELTLSHNENSNVFEPTNRLKYKRFVESEYLTRLVLMQLWKCDITGKEEWREIEIEK